MRARKKKNTIPRLERCEEYITQEIIPQEGKPLYIEIGCGKGNFITGHAERNPQSCYYAMEKVPDVIVMAIEKAKEKELNNLRFLIEDAENLPEICPPNSVDIIYLNFSDPWPKKKRAKRRLTYRFFLEKYKTILKFDGEIHFKTDNIPLFDFSLEEFKLCGFDLYDVTRDLDSSGIDNPFRTEYETRFIDQGIPICHLKAKVHQ